MHNNVWYADEKRCVSVCVGGLDSSEVTLDQGITWVIVTG